MNDCSKFINTNRSVLEDCRSAYISQTLSEQFITFRVSCRRREMYMVTRACVSVCLCVYVPRITPTLLHGPGCNFANGRECAP